MRQLINQIREVPREQKIKVTLIVLGVVLAIAALISFIAVRSYKNTNVGEIYFYDTYAAAKEAGISVTVESSSGFKNKPYVVSVAEYGPIFEGNTYSTGKAAVANPLVIDSGEKSIIIATESNLTTLKKGNSTILTHYGHYLYVVVV